MTLRSHDAHLLAVPGLGIRSFHLWVDRPFFAKKLRMSNSLKKMSDSLIFGELPEQFAQVRSFLVSDLSKLLTLAHVWWATWVICSHCSFLVSDLSNSLTSLTKKEGMSKFFKNLQKFFLKIYKKNKKISNKFERFILFCEQKSEWAICSKKN